jgi:hypothetical protein
MSKILKISLLFVFVLIFSTQLSYANNTGTVFSFKKFFAGKIIANEASRITQLQSTGYECTIPGATVEIKPQSIKMPKSYYLTKTKDGKLPVNKSIIGSYAGKTEITCILKAEPPLVEVVSLDTIKTYGVPKKY